MLIGAIADDFTGASDLANTLARGGMSTTQFIGIPKGAPPDGCEAGVVALKTRSIPAEDAVAQSLEVLEWLKAQGCRQILFKYCSTFDSTPAGNIGPVAEALLDALSAPCAVVCPAFPTTGRTIYMGHLFVNDRLLSESGMEKHPLTPMTDPDIRRWLARQTTVPVGHVPYRIVREGPDAIRAALGREAEAGRRLVVADAIVDDDLLSLGAALKDAALVTGGSGIALGLPLNFAGEGLLKKTAGGLPAVDGPACVLSGSCSIASRAQVAAYAAKHPAFEITPSDLIERRKTATEMLALVEQAPRQTRRLCSPPRSRTRSRRRRRNTAATESPAPSRNSSPSSPSRLVESGVRRIVIAGGETSGAIITALGVKELKIGREIDPGVPALVSGGDPVLGLALKSGNFGGTDFFEKALNALAAP